MPRERRPRLLPLVRQSVRPGRAWLASSRCFFGTPVFSCQICDWAGLTCPSCMRRGRFDSFLPGWPPAPLPPLPRQGPREQAADKARWESLIACWFRVPPLSLARFCCLLQLRRDGLARLVRIGDTARAQNVVACSFFLPLFREPPAGQVDRQAVTYWCSYSVRSHAIDTAQDP